MSTKQAIRPDFFQSLPTIIKDQQAKNKGITAEEQDLYALSQSSGWRVLRQYAESLLEDLNNATDIAMAQGLTFDEIGRNAIVANLAKGIIKKVLNKVKDASEAAELPDGTRK